MNALEVVKKSSELKKRTGMQLYNDSARFYNMPETDRAGNQNSDLRRKDTENSTLNDKFSKKGTVDKSKVRKSIWEDNIKSDFRRIWQGAGLKIPKILTLNLENLK